MACGTPVVATSQAVSALQARAGADLLVADEPAEFADAVVRLLDDATLRAQVGSAGRQYVEQYHDWDRIVECLVGMYREEMERAARPRRPGSIREFRELHESENANA